MHDFLESHIPRGKNTACGNRELRKRGVCLSTGAQRPCGVAHSLAAGAARAAVACGKAAAAGALLRAALPKRCLRLKEPQQIDSFR